MLDNLRQPPLNTTQMGVLRGLADYFGLDVSTATLFGGTGHAFVINIHEAMCPSGPYLWHPGRFNQLVRNIGIETRETRVLQL